MTYYNALLNKFDICAEIEWFLSAPLFALEGYMWRDALECIWKWLKREFSLLVHLVCHEFNQISLLICILMAFFKFLHRFDPFSTKFDWAFRHYSYEIWIDTYIEFNARNNSNSMEIQPFTKPWFSKNDLKSNRFCSSVAVCKTWISLETHSQQFSLRREIFRLR